MLRALAVAVVLLERRRALPEARRGVAKARAIRAEQPLVNRARDKARANGRQVEWWAGAQPLRRVDDELHAMGFAGRADWW